MNYSVEQIIALAPDAASAKAGRSLATASKWQNVGQDERAVWGECQGSGAKPYQTVIDLSEPAFKCSCPSRKFPCKHALGLFLLIANQPAAGNTTVPAWAAEWLGKRDEQTQRRNEAAKKADEVPDEATLARRASQKAKRSLDREAKVVAGLKELELWLRDLLRHGLASAQTRTFDYWEQMAARLIDAGFDVRCCDLYPEIFRLDGVDIHRGNLDAELPFGDQSFDYVTCLEGLEHIENPQQAMREFARVLKPGGHLFVSVPNILNIEERLKWLLHGYTSHFKPISRAASESSIGAGRWHPRDCSPNG